MAEHLTASQREAYLSMAIPSVDSSPDAPLESSSGEILQMVSATDSQSGEQANAVSGDNSCREEDARRVVVLESLDLSHNNMQDTPSIGSICNILLSLRSLVRIDLRQNRLTAQDKKAIGSALLGEPYGHAYDYGQHQVS
jgi:hypothetical protein